MTDITIPVNVDLATAISAAQEYAELAQNAADTAAEDAATGAAAAIAPVLATAEGYRDQAHGYKDDAATSLANTLAAERRIRAQDLGDFANDAAAIAWAAAQSPVVSIFVGSSYWNTTTLIKRVCSNSSGTPTFVDEDADAQTQRTNAAASAVAAAAIQADLNNRFLGPFSTDPSWAGAPAGSPPWVNGARYYNTLSGKERVWRSVSGTYGWHDVDEDAQTAATAAAGAATTATGARDTTTAARDTTLAARDVATGARDTALGYSTAASSAYANTAALQAGVAQSALIAQQAAASAQTATNLSILAAAQRAIALMTDGVCDFIYDTRRDSDGGAWVDKCVSQSWATEALNTATRGASAKFPKMALIVGRNALSAAITIYDATDPTLPVWMVFSGASLSFMGSYAGSGITAGSISIAALNGKMFVSYGNSEGTRTVDFISDTASVEYSNVRLVWNGRLADRNLTTLSVSQLPNGVQALTHYSVAATVLPNTPLNPLRCNLPNPTVAVGTNGGVSVIRADGVVCNSSNTAAFWSVAFDTSGNLWTHCPSNTTLNVASIAHYCSASWAVYGIAAFTTSTQIPIGTIPQRAICAVGPGMVAIAGSTGLATIKLDPTNPANSLYRVKTTTYDTGWMVLGKTSFALAESAAALSAYAGAAAIADKSSSASNFTCVGGLSRAQVASGADLAGLTGWGVGNYATGATIALGSADFEFPISIVGASITGTQTYLSHGYYTAGAYSGARMLLQSSTSTLTATFHDGANSASISVSSALAAGGNYDLRVIYRSALTRFELWSNGVLIGTAARGSVGSLTNASANLFIGIDPALANPTVSTVILALIRAWTYATTPDQIAFMRADEKGRFVANEKELLSGANVQAVAFDPDTNQLAASNSTGGTDVFAGPGFSVRVANWKSTTATNLVKGSALPSSFTYTAASLGSKVAGPTSWGGGEAWALNDTNANAAHYWSQSYTAPGGAITLLIPMQAAAQGGGVVNHDGGTFAVFNLSTGALISQSGTSGQSSASMGNGFWLLAINVSPAAGGHSIYGMSATSAGATSYVGSGAAAINFGKPMVLAGTYTATQALALYSDGLSANDNHKAVAFAGGDLVVATGAGVDAFLGVKPGLRETAGGVGAPRRAFYDPTWGQFYGFTTDATPTVFASIPIPEGKAYRFRASVVAVMYGGTATEKAVYDITGVVSRDIGGNVVVVSTTTTISEVTSTMDCVAQANTTAQTLEIKATGKASTRIAWFDGQELYDVGLMAAA